MSKSKKKDLPTPVQLSSGSWRIRMSIDRVVYSITEPTYEQCVLRAMDMKEALAPEGGTKKGPNKKKPLTVRTAIDKHISLHPTLSPSTVKGYHKIQELWLQDIMDLPLSSIKNERVQKSVNKELYHLSPKTLKNAYALVRMVVKEFAGYDLHCTLPSVPRSNLGFLDKEQLPIFLKALKGHKGEVPILLGLSSLRRSEILDMTWDDIDLQNDIIHVRGAAVVGDKGLVHKKTNKTAASRRDIPFILPQLKEALQNTPHKSQYIVTCNENMILSWVHQVCDIAGLPRITVHDLRRTFCTVGYFLDIPPKVLQVWGGWESMDVVNDVYLKLDTTASRESAVKFTNFFNEML